MPTRTFGSYQIQTSREEKVLFPEARITRGELIDYYTRIAEVMLPHLHDRPITMHRWPDGLEGQDFYQKQAPEHFPDWIERVSIEQKGDGTQPQVLVQNAATLAYLANQACITPHAWLSRRDRLDHPDQMIADLDPPGGDFDAVRQAARLYREVLDDLGLPAYVKTTGSRGLHVLVPLDRGADFDTARDFAQDLARLLAHRQPDRLTTEARREKRGDRLYLDTARNAYGQTAVAPYAVRALPGAPIATPIEWDELGDRELDAQTYHLRNLFHRLGQKEDPWADLRRHAHGLKAPRRRLDRMLREVEDEG